MTTIDRRTWSAAMLGTLALPGLARAAAPRPAGNVLRVPFVAAETGFDPARVGDLYSRTVTAHIFEAPYRYDLFADPVKVRPLTAAALPEVSADFRVWTIRLQPGIFFADDPAFKGRRRELVAEDYVYALKRFFDPATISPGYTSFQEEKIVGLQAVRDAALRDRKPFDYDRPVEGLIALDRYTFRITLAEPRPRFLSGNLCDSSLVGAVAREVVEHYGAEIAAHPVSTGPYRLKEWRRSSRIVLERNPSYREVLYDGEPEPGDADGHALLARFKGRRLPLNDGVEIAVLEEAQARWLSFLRGEIDYVRPAEFTTVAMPNGRLAPNLAKRGVQARRYVNADFTMSWFNMDDPVVGGYTPEKVALRRALELAYNMPNELHLVRRDQGIYAQSPIIPGTFGYDPHYKSSMSDYDPARAKALLDLYGYVDRNGDGWRERPDGSPLELKMASQGSQIERQFNEIWQKSLAAVGVKIRFDIAQWPENMKAARAGRLQMWSLGSTASTPDSQGALQYMYGPSIGSSNLARFKWPAFDWLYERAQLMPDSPERAAVLREAVQLVEAYMPYRVHAHRIYVDLSQPWLAGWRSRLFRLEQWQYAEVDTALRDRLLD